MDAIPATKRIDAGIKRGPRIRKGLPTKPSAQADLGAWVIPKDLNPHEILERYLSEATTSQIASQYGLSRKALVKWLRLVVPDEWKQVQLIRAHVNLETGEDGIQAAEDENSALSLACARERIKAAQWRLQALDVDYQPKQQLTVDVNHHINVDQALSEQAVKLVEQIRSVADNSSCTALEGQVIDVPITNDTK